MNYEEQVSPSIRRCLPAPAAGRSLVTPTCSLSYAVLDFMMKLPGPRHPEECRESRQVVDETENSDLGLDGGLRYDTYKILQHPIINT
jgi:hypothetical protein